MKSKSLILLAVAAIALVPSTAVAWFDCEYHVITDGTSCVYYESCNIYSDTTGQWIGHYMGPRHRCD